MAVTVCVTEKEYNKAAAVFRGASALRCVSSSLRETELAGAVRANRASAVILGVDPYVGALYAALPRGGVIARFGVGHDGVDKAQATEHGIIVTNTPGVLDDSVAEHAIWLMGALARQIAVHDANMKARRWLPDNGIELKGKTLLLLGCGAIGKKTACRAHFGLGMTVIGYDIAPLDAAQMRAQFGISTLTNDLGSALRRADFVSVHLPAIEATQHLVNADFLAQMKPTAYIVNTARGAVLDERALYRALRRKQIAGAALDVFETEPYVPQERDEDLRDLDNVILTPHVASSTTEACTRMAVRCLENITAACNKNYDKLDVVNPEVLAMLQ